MPIIFIVNTRPYISNTNARIMAIVRPRRLRLKSIIPPTVPAIAIAAQAKISWLENDNLISSNTVFGSNDLVTAKTDTVE